MTICHRLSRHVREGYKCKSFDFLICHSVVTSILKCLLVTLCLRGSDGALRLALFDLCDTPVVSLQHLHAVAVANLSMRQPVFCPTLLPGQTECVAVRHVDAATHLIFRDFPCLYFPSAVQALTPGYFQQPVVRAVVQSHLQKHLNKLVVNDKTVVIELPLSSRGTGSQRSYFIHNNFRKLSVDVSWRVIVTGTQADHKEYVAELRSAGYSVESGDLFKAVDASIFIADPLSPSGQWIVLLRRMLGLWATFHDSGASELDILVPVLQFPLAEFSTSNSPRPPASVPQHLLQFQSAVYFIKSVMLDPAFNPYVSRLHGRCQSCEGITVCPLLAQVNDDDVSGDECSSSLVMDESVVHQIVQIFEQGPPPSKATDTSWLKSCHNTVYEAPAVQAPGKLSVIKKLHMACKMLGIIS